MMGVTIPHGNDRHGLPPAYEDLLLRDTASGEDDFDEGEPDEDELDALMQSAVRERLLSQLERTYGKKSGQRFC